jgi:hypothetical protein
VISATHWAALNVVGMVRAGHDIHDFFIPWESSRIFERAAAGTVHQPR